MTTEPLRIVKVQKNTITIDESGVPTTVSIEKLTNAPAKFKQRHCATTSVQPELKSPKDGTPSVAGDNNTNKGE